MAMNCKNPAQPGAKLFEGESQESEAVRYGLMFEEEDFCDETGEYDVPPQLWHDPEDDSDDDSDDYEYDIETSNRFGVLKRSTDVQSPVRPKTPCGDDGRSTDVLSLARPTSPQVDKITKQGLNKIRVRSERSAGEQEELEGGG